MKVIIAGGRDFIDIDYALECINKLITEGHITQEGLEIVSGMANGADTVGINIAKDNDLPLHSFPPDWTNLGKSAGYVRNTHMANFADVLVAFWNRSSRGTAHMIQTMKNRGKPTFVFYY